MTWMLEAATAAAAAVRVEAEADRKAWDFSDNADGLAKYFLVQGFEKTQLLPGWNVEQQNFTHTHTRTHTCIM